MANHHVMDLLVRSYGWNNRVEKYGVRDVTGLSDGVVVNSPIHSAI